MPILPGKLAYQSTAVIVRAVSVAALAATVLAVAAHSGGAVSTALHRLAPGHRFWRGMGEWGATLAVACFIPSLILPVCRKRFGDESQSKATNWCVWLNLTTILLLLFVPALAAL